MSIISTNYDLETDQYGLAVITKRGRCTADERAAIEANATRRFRMEPLPNMSGAVLKALDGTSPAIVEVTPATFGSSVRYRCVKVDGRCRPLAPVQVGGPYNGKAILAYTIKYQQVGGIA